MFCSLIHYFFLLWLLLFSVSFLQAQTEEKGHTESSALAGDVKEEPSNGLPRLEQKSKQKSKAERRKRKLKKGMPAMNTVQEMESSKVPDIHLFILSGQSNMARFKPDLWFTPGISKALGAENVVVNLHAKGGQPISQWYKKWRSGKGETDPSAGKIYDLMMKEAKAATAGKKIQTVTFIWMQGEADAKAKNDDVYLASLNGLKTQLEQDLNRTDINFIIGRLSDSGFYRRRDKKRIENSHWGSIRKAQEAFTKASEKAVLVKTDDLNGEKNELHYTSKGYAELGKRYVREAIKLLDIPTK